MHVRREVNKLWSVGCLEDTFSNGWKPSHGRQIHHDTWKLQKIHISRPTNKIYWHVATFTYVWIIYSCLHAMACKDLSSCNKDIITAKPKIFYHLVHCNQSLPNSGLQYKQGAHKSSLEKMALDWRTEGGGFSRSGVIWLMLGMLYWKETREEGVKFSEDDVFDKDSCSGSRLCDQKNEMTYYSGKDHMRRRCRKMIKRSVWNQ